MFTYSNGYWEVCRRFQGDFFGLGGGLRGRVTWDDISMEKLFMREENFNEGSAGFSSIILKINMKKFFQLEVRSSIET